MVYSTEPHSGEGSPLDATVPMALVGVFLQLSAEGGQPKTPNLKNSRTLFFKYTIHLYSVNEIVNPVAFIFTVLAKMRYLWGRYNAGTLIKFSY